MPTGFKRGDYDFGDPEFGKGAAPLPADIARSASAAPLPSDAAESRVRRRFAGRLPSETGVRKGRSNDAAQQGSQHYVASELHEEDRRLRMRKTAVIAVILALLTVFSLFVDGGYQKLFNPIEVFTCYGIWIQQAIAQVTHPSSVIPANDILASGHMEYFRILNRVNVTVMTVLCGGVLAVAGSLYQMVFRNPIASPSMLGVSSAIQLGDMIVVLVFGTSAAAHLGERYLICYACVIVAMVVLFACGRLMSGKGRPLNVVNLLLIAMILTQLIGVIVTYYTTMVFTWEMWEVFNSLTEALSVNGSLFGWIALLATCAIGLVPIVLLRFRMNGLSFDDAEMKLLGIDATRLRVIALVCGTILLMGVQVQMGTVALLALVVPHLSRMLFGAEFRKQFWGNVLLGAALLVFCRIVVGFIPLIGSLLPISVILNFVVLPFFVWMLATQQRTWG